MFSINPAFRLFRSIVYPAVLYRNSQITSIRIYYDFKTKKIKILCEVYKLTAKKFTKSRLRRIL